MNPVRVPDLQHASPPLLPQVVDSTGLVIYFWIAKLVMGI